MWLNENKDSGHTVPAVLHQEAPGLANQGSDAGFEVTLHTCPASFFQLVFTQMT